MTEEATTPILTRQGAIATLRLNRPRHLNRIEPDDLRKKGRVPTNASVFLTIFQTFMSGPPAAAQGRATKLSGPCCGLRSSRAACP
jgi:hypothetical protein